MQAQKGGFAARRRRRLTDAVAVGWDPFVVVGEPSSAAQLEGRREVERAGAAQRSGELQSVNRQLAAGSCKQCSPLVETGQDSLLRELTV